MKRHLTILLILALVTLPGWALDQKFLEPTTPVSPTLKGMGGASTANAEGWDALFVNPAAYASKTSTLTFLDTGVSAYLPLAGLSQTLADHASWGMPNFTDSQDPMMKLINSLLTQYGVGAESTVGAGWVGNNLGVGVLLQARSFAKGLTLLGSKITLDQSVTGVVGMAWPFDVGLGTLKLGGAIKPQQKTFAEIPATDLLGFVGGDASTLMNDSVQSGFGLGWDLGLRWDVGGFRTGLVIRDAGSPVYSFREFAVSDWIGSFGLPSGGSTSGTTLYRVPTVIALGTAWTPDLGSLNSLVVPTFALDLQVPVKDEFTQSSFWTWLHLGAEAKFLKFLALRAGINQGYFTFGLGAKLFILDLNLAIYADELGRYSGVNRRSALALDLAFRL